jgi:hypothetical protein
MAVGTRRHSPMRCCSAVSQAAADNSRHKTGNTCLTAAQAMSWLADSSRHKTGNTCLTAAQAMSWRCVADSTGEMPFRNAGLNQTGKATSSTLLILPMKWSNFDIRLDEPSSLSVKGKLQKDKGNCKTLVTYLLAEEDRCLGT